jgi:hypothetical protein
MDEFTELEMADAFEHTLKASLVKGIPNFDILYREVSCQQGIPDFVGLSSAVLIQNYDFSNLTATESCSIIMSILKRNSGRRKEYIKEKTALSDATLNRALKELLSNGLIVEKNNLYFLSINDNSQKDSIWAFELKLSNWKRALFQALQYKAFANYVAVVLPYERENILRKNLSTFITLNVGVLLFDPKGQKSKWLRRPKKEVSISKWQTLFLLGKISNQHSQENKIPCLESNLGPTNR